MKEYWKDIEAKNGNPVQLPDESAREDNSIFSMFDDLKEEGSSSRRDFLKLCGFSFTVAALASCQTKIRKAVPYAVAPLEITPGEANYYASSFIDGSDYCSVVVKSREGRPIKIEGNQASGISMGGTSARVQASVLDLYDTSRYQGPLKNGSAAGWADVDAEIKGKLGEISKSGGKIVLLTPTIYSPSTESVITGFLGSFPGSEWQQYDAVSRSGMLEANLASFGVQALPDYRFDKADLVVSFGADFLGNWISPVEYTKQFSSRRNPDKEMNELIQFESNLSLTGSNADRRIQMKPSEEGDILLNIYKDVAEAVEGISVNAPASPIDISGLSKQLLKARGKSLLISASNVKDIQLLVNEINKLLGNIGETVLFDNYLRTYGGLDSEMSGLVESMKAGEVDALLVYDVNPVYNWVDTEGFVEGMKRVGLTVSLGVAPDETSELAGYVCPVNHYLESWNDAEPKKNKFSLMQPVMDPILNTRQFQDTLLNWSLAGPGSLSGAEAVEGAGALDEEDGGAGFYGFLNAYWAEKLMPLQAVHMNPEPFFDHSLRDGVFEPEIAAGSVEEEDSMAAEAFDLSRLDLSTGSGSGAFEVVSYESITMGTGRQANNPWLHELPDPVSRICWDNYACISSKQAGELGLSTGDMVQAGNMIMPAYVQPGQAYGTLGLALGYGRETCGPVGRNIGVNARTLLRMFNGNVQYSGLKTDISKTGEKHLFAQTQSHHSMEGRALVREAGLNAYKEDPAAGNEMHAHFEELEGSLYDKRDFPHHHWGMAIDLSSCTGCANCVVACQAENNIPVVGKEEVTRVHEMHWMRIDRYFSGDEENPEVVFQPVMCQHCDNAPCENVCPVAATNSSSEGLNQMVYNRCIGTRYCNNNCPYKVRRFNWFNYTEAGTISGNLRDKAEMTSDLRRMVLNPDVTVRSQGVIEKCSFCIQRIQSAKLNAKAENRGIKDEELQTACSQSCPANSIVFGDMNDPDSEISKLIESGRRYNLLEEIYTKPSVHYLTKIRNKNT